MKKTLLFLPLLLSACARTVTDGAAVLYEGFYTWGFEANGFQPCGSTETWWVTEGDLHTRYEALGVGEYEPVYVELAGEVGPAGSYGHMGAHPREIAVKEVLEIRPARDGDCR